MSLRAWRYGWRYGVGLKRRKASQTRRLARLETADFVMFLVAWGRNRHYLSLNFAKIEGQFDRSNIAQANI